MDLETYWALKKHLAPRLRFNQVIYEETLQKHVSAGDTWLDAGCGRHVLPAWRQEAERDLVARAGLAVGCDADESSLRVHRSLARRVVANLEHLPFKGGSVDLITSNMVVEHLDQPGRAFAEFARVLRPGGRVILHTPNIYSHFVLGSRLLPHRLKRKLMQSLDGRSEHEVFPTRYRANSRSTLRALMRQAGLRQDWCRMVANDAVFARTNRILAGLELLYIRLTLLPALRALRVTILASFSKPH